MMPWQLKEKRFQTALTAKKNENTDCCINLIKKRINIMNFAAKKLAIHKLSDFKKS